MTQIRNIMTRNPIWVLPTSTLSDVADIMALNGISFIPIGENDRIVGTVTAHDIVKRGLSRNGDPKVIEVRDIMTPRVYYCYDDQTIDDVLDNMNELRVRRLPVVNRHKRMIGVVALRDIMQIIDTVIPELLDTRISAHQLNHGVIAA